MANHRTESRNKLDRKFVFVQPLLSRLEPRACGWIRAIRTSIGMSADALDCDAYCIVLPRRSLESKLEHQAQHAALLRTGGYDYRGADVEFEDAEHAKLMKVLVGKPTTLW